MNKSKVKKNRTKKKSPSIFIRKTKNRPKTSRHLSHSNGKSFKPSSFEKKLEPIRLYRAILIGKPNVGKSSLLNVLTYTDSSIITKVSGTTRDSVNRVIRSKEEAVMLSDLPGWDEGREKRIKTPDPKAFQKVCEQNIINPIVFKVLKQEVDSSDIIIIVTDINDITSEDRMILDWVQKYNHTHKSEGKPVIYCANKCDNRDAELSIGEVYEIGAENVIPVSSKMKRGLNLLIKELFDKYHKLITDAIPSHNPYVFYPTCDYKLAIVGKPNVGKSSLFNALLQKERAVVSEVAGTTRDLVEDNITVGKHIVKLIDTGGLRRKSRKKTLPESYSVEKAVHAVNQSEVVILVIDATEGLSDQDKKIASLALGKKKSLVMAFNKWDLLQEKWEHYLEDLRLTFSPIIKFPILPISCINRKNLAKLLKTADELYQDRSRRINIEELNRSLRGAEEMKSLAGGGGVRIRYAMQVQNHPPVFYIYVNNLNRVKNHFRKYLYNHLEKLYSLEGTSLTLRFFEHKRSKSNTSKPL